MRACIAAPHGVEKDNVWLGNLVEHAVGMVHGRGCGAGSAGIDELGEDSQVILEVGLDGVGLYLLELSERGAFGYEGKKVWQGCKCCGCGFSYCWCFCDGFRCGRVWVELENR